MFNFFKRKKKKVNIRIDEQLEAKDIYEASRESENNDKYSYDFNLTNMDFYENTSENLEQNSSFEVSERNYTEEEIHKIIIQQILRVIDSGADFNSMQTAAEEACRIIGKENVPLISTYIKDRVSKPTYMKGKFDELGQWPIAVENSVLSILYSFKEDGVDELLKVVDSGGNACLKAINLLCKLAAKGIEREKIVDSLIYLIKVFDEEDKYKVLGYFSQIKGHGKIERLYELYYKKFILEGNLDSAYDIILNLINIRGRYTREQIIFIKALALFDSELDTNMILEGEDGVVSFANVDEQLRIKAAISFYSLNKMDSEINERLYYLKNNSLDSELRAFLSETLE
ncbi:MAG: hypothetical protein MJ191_04490 [Clostridium sp.]|nr:hypothetical protein [Clostridium sp.]